MSFLVSAFGSWLLGQCANAARSQLSQWVFTGEQERALRGVADAAIVKTVRELRQDASAEEVGHFAAVVDEVFRLGVPFGPFEEQATFLEALQAATAAQLAVLEDVSLTGTRHSSADILGISPDRIAERLIHNIIQGIVVRGVRGGPLACLADQLNHDLTHQQANQAAGMLSQILEEVTRRSPGDRYRTAPPELHDLRMLLPDRPASFIGRSEELGWLAQPRTEPVVVTQALAGLGGVGKTTLALEYAHRCFYAEQVVDLAWWFSAADRLSLCATMARLYEHLTGMTGLEDSVLGAERLRNWLESCPYRWLVVFDNADIPGVLEGLIPHAGTGQVLITSRRSDWDGAIVRRLDVLPPEDSMALLRTLTGLDDDEGARLLAQELDGLAVALQQAGAFVRKMGWTYEHYLSMLRSRPLALHSEDLANTGTTVAKVWETSLDQATGSDQTLAGNLLSALAYLAAENIPRLLFQPPVVDHEATFGATDPLEVDLALVRLSEYCLVNLEGDAISLHRLVQHLTRAHLDQQGSAAEHVATAICLLRGAIATAGRTTELVTRLLSHVTEAADHAARLSVPPQDTVSLLNTAAEDRLAISQLDIARSLLDRAMGIAIASLAPNDPATLTTRNYLARWSGEMGRADIAVAQLQEVLQDRLLALGPDHPETLRTRSNLAFFMGQSGRVHEAIAQFRELTTDRSRVLGPDHPDTLWIRGNLAFLLRQAGKTDEAVAEFQALLDDHRRGLGPDHLYTLRIRNGLASTLVWAGRADEAIVQFQALLGDDHRVLGPDHLYTLRTRNSLAFSLTRVGRIDEAVCQLQAVLEDLLRLLGPDHPTTLRTRNRLASMLDCAGRPTEAVAQLETLLEADRRVLGPSHPYTLRAEGDLAILLGRTRGTGGMRTEQD